jgi:hypothetical protein
MILPFIVLATLNSHADRLHLKYLMICPVLPDPDPGLDPSLASAMAALFRRRQQLQLQPLGAELDLGTSE